MGKSKKTIIDLNSIRAKKYHYEDEKENKDISNHILLESYYKKIVKLISDRIEEIKLYKKRNFDINNINEVKMHDAILIYGSRGNGKSTVMINLKDFITGRYNELITGAKELENRVYIFNTIDPTIQEDDEDFLLVILSTILKEVEEIKQDKYKNRDGFYDSLEKVLNIVEATRSKKKYDIDIFDKFYGLKSGVGLAEELHNLFSHTKDIFGVDILIIPIDDVDMNLKQGYQIADSIRKYMSSPYIIPIVAFNIKQMRVVTKYNKYKEFGLKIDDNLDLEELSFLRSLPNDYLSKVFPPNRRIYLKSVFEILQKATSYQKDNVIFTMNDIKLKSFDMISLLAEIFYESYYTGNDFKDIADSVFLSNRSMRNFLNDCYAIVYSLEYNKDNNNYNINRKVIKDRLAPDDINAFVTKGHALTWLWNEYIDIAKKNLENLSRNSLKNYNWARMITETLPEDSSAEVINKKIYTRVWLQEYYRVDEKVVQNKNTNHKEFFLHKNCNIAGALELAMRSYIPMYLFESIVKNRNLKYNSSDLVYLRNFSSKTLLDIAYELSMMEMSLYKGKNSGFEPKAIGSLVVYESIKNDKNKTIKDKEFNIPFLFKVLNQDKIEAPYEENKQIYILSIFKAMALFIELVSIYQRDGTKADIIDLIERYRINIPNAIKAEEMSKEYFKQCIKDEKYCTLKEQNKNRLNINFRESSFGILEIARFSKRLVDFFMNIRDNIEDSNLTKFKTNKKYKKSEKSNFHIPLITYFTSFTQSLFISLFNSIKKDNLLSIKIIDKEDEIIFRKNSLYGTKDNPTKYDHLYEKNISNLRKAFEQNREIKNHNNFEIEIQEQFNNLFQFINTEIPFFNFLIKEANFLTKIETNNLV
jgi:hypothetical protein